MISQQDNASRLMFQHLVAGYVYSIRWQAVCAFSLPWTFYEYPVLANAAADQSE
jgi:hypothetical protein